MLILGFAGVALLVDRLFLGGDDGPQSASASDFLLPRANDVAQAEEHAELAPIPELPFPRTVDRFASADVARDVFTPPGLPDPGNSDESGQNQQENPRNSMASNAVGRAAFADRHQVTAIIHDEGLKIAVIDGRWMRVGERLDSCELVEIERRSAHFKCYDGGVILEFSLGKRD